MRATLEVTGAAAGGARVPPVGDLRAGARGRALSWHRRAVARPPSGGKALRPGRGALTHQGGGASVEDDRDACELGREDSIESLKACDHAGFLYSDDAQRAVVLARLEASGRARRERFVLIGPEDDPERGGPVRALSAHREIADPVSLLRRLRDEALGAGDLGLRVAFEMAWVLGSLAGLERMHAWERRIHVLLEPGAPFVIVCMYDRRRFGATFLAEALDSHPIVILHDRAHPNVYHEPSRVWDHTDHVVAGIRDVIGSQGVELKILREQTARGEAEAAARRAMFLAEASIVLTSSLDLDTIFAQVAELAVPALADWCVVHVIDHAHQARRVATAQASQELRRHAEELWERWPLRLDGPHPIATVLRAGEPLVVPQVTDEMLRGIARDDAHLAALRALGIQSFLVVPLRARGQIHGSIAFAAAESGRRYTPRDLAFAEALSRRAALAVDNAWLYALSERRRREAESLAELSHLVSGSLDPTELARRIVDSAQALLGGRSTSLLRLDPATGDLTVVAVAGVQDGVNLKGLRLPAGEGLVGLAVDQSRPFITADVLGDEHVRTSPELRALLEQDRARALLAVPMTANGRVLGVLRVADRCGRAFTSDEIRLASSFAAHAAMAEVNSRLYAQAEQLAVERERVRVAGELHDTLSQVVFSVGLKLDWCLRQPLDADVREKLEGIRRDAGFVMEQIRRLIDKLSVPEHGADPLARLRQLFADFRELTGIKLDDTITGDMAALDAERQETLGKLVQEALTNVAKHARSARAWLRIEVDGDGVRFEVADDGVGPRAADGEARPQRAAGFGLQQMRDRLEAIGGRLEYGANPPTGFRVWGTFPTRSSEVTTP